MESLKHAAHGAWHWLVETTWGLLAVMFSIYLLVGTMDYRDQRSDECASKGLVWDSQSDTCRKAEGGAK
jgi:hypothetical protein